MKKLVAYITTGYPDLEFTIDASLALKEAGVDMIELGVPFSDPVADGPIIEKANLQSLQNGFKIDQLIEISNKITKHIDTLWMGYFNPFYQRGIKKIINEAHKANITGFIIPDLPYEESLLYIDEFEQHDLTLISFVAPTDTKDRINTILKNSKKFIYLVAYAGITGSGKSEKLTKIISNIRDTTDTDIYIGFGVNEKTAKEKARGVDGVIVGSAFVSIMLNQQLTSIQKIKSMQILAQNIKDKINS